MSQWNKLDRSFGNNGSFLLNLNGMADMLTDVKVQVDGKILCLGYSDYEAVLIRLTNNGKIDSSFNGGTPIRINLYGDYYIQPKLEIQQDRKILIASSKINITSLDFAVYRLHPNGTFDSSFAVNGKFIHNYDIEDYFNSMNLLTDGSILVAGTAMDSADPFQYLFKLKPNGTLDSTFDNDGIVKGDVWPSYLNNTIPANLAGMTIDKNDKIITYGGSTSHQIVRLNSNGMLDSTFDDDGFKQFNYLSNDELPQCLAVQDNGKILMGAQVDPNVGISDFEIIRLNSNGTIDSTFATNGAKFGQYSSPENKMKTIVPLSDSSFLAIVNTYNWVYTADFAQFSVLLKFTNNGNNVDANNIVNTDIMRQANTLFVQPNRKILVCGGISNSSIFDPNILSVFRYNGFYTCNKNPNTSTDSFTNFSNDSSAFNCSNWSSGFYPDSMVNIIINSGSVLKIRKGETLKVHNIFVENGGKILMSGGVLKLYGNIDAVAFGDAINCDSGKIVFCGNDTNKIMNTLPSFYNVEVNKPSGIVFLDDYGFEVKGHLELTKGIIIINGSGSVEIMSGATASQGNPLSYIAGEIRAYNIATSSFIFPTGKGDKWARIGIENLSGGNWRAEYFNQMYPDTNTMGSTLTNVSTKEYWDLEPDGPYSVNVKLYWEDASWSGIDLSQNSTNLRVAHFSNTTLAWENAGNGSISFTNSGSVTSTLFNDFSPFTFGSTTPLIPLNKNQVKLFANRQNHQKVILSINVENILGIDSIEILRKLQNENDFITIYTSNSFNTNLIPYLDYNSSDISWYRAKIHYKNGKCFSNLCRVLKSNTSNEIIILPNPAFSEITITDTDQKNIISLEIRDITGRIVLLKKDVYSNNEKLNISEIKNGQYIIKITTESGVYYEKITISH